MTVLDVKRLCSEIHRILINNGILVLGAPYVHSPSAWIDYTHVRPYTKSALAMLAEDFKFRVIQINYDYHIGIPGFGLLRLGFLRPLVGKVIKKYRGDLTMTAICMKDIKTTTRTKK
jgi:hypothetical protein